MIRDEDELALVVFCFLSSIQQPGLYLSQCDLVVRLIHEDSMAFHNREVENHVELGLTQERGGSEVGTCSLGVVIS